MIQTTLFDLKTESEFERYDAENPQVYQCVVCEVCYNRYNKARDCCVKVRTLEQCDYCEELFSTWHAAARHPLNRRCPREIENEK